MPLGDGDTERFTLYRLLVETHAEIVVDCVNTATGIAYRDPSTHLLGAGTAMCAGCGGLLAVRQIYDVLGPKTVFVNAAGCMTLLAVYPFTPFTGSWIYTSMASGR